MRTSVQRGGLGLVGITLAVAGLAVLSARTGGPVSWHITTGTSMKPGITAGTLVVVHEKPSYDVGDVVAYRSAELRSTILHRVVDVQPDGRMVLQGDNNDWTDSDRPLPEDALGARAFQVGGVGDALSWLRQPAAMGTGAAMIALPFLGGTERRRRRRTGPSSAYSYQGLPTSGRTRDDEGTAPSRPAQTRLRLPTSGPTWDPDLDLVPAPRSTTAQPARAAAAGSPPGLLGPLGLLGLLGLLGQLTVPRGLRVPAAVETAIAMLAAVSLLLAVLATGGPFVRTAAPSRTASHVVTWAYDAAVAPGLVYQGGRVQTGDTLYTRLVDEADVTARLRFEVPEGTQVRGQWRLDVKVEDANGWRRTTSVGSPAPLDGAARLDATLPITGLLSIARRAAAESGVDAGSWTFTVVAVLDLTATTDGEPVSTEATSTLAFDADSDKLRPSTDTPLEQSGGLRLTPGEQGDEQLRLLGTALPAGPTQVVGGLLALLALAALVVMRLARRDEDEDIRIARTHPRLLVPMDDLQEPQLMVDISSFEALAAVASGYDRMVLFGDHDGLRVYLVLDDGVAYRYFDAEAAARLDGPDGQPGEIGVSVEAQAEAPLVDPAHRAFWGEPADVGALLPRQRSAEPRRTRR